MKKKIVWIAALFALSFVVMAAIVTVNLSNPPYNQLSMVRGQNIYSEVEVKIGIGFEAVQTYNRLNANKLGKGDQVKIVYQDGSSEQYAVNSTMLSGGIVPIPGTQKPNSSAGSGGGPFDPGLLGGGLGTVGGSQFQNCFQTTQRIGVDVGGEGMKWTTVTVLECP